jgi:hypothetical protein
VRRRRRRILLPCFANAKPLPEAGNNNYLGSEWDHLPEAGNIYIYCYPFLRPPIRPYLGNVAKLIRRRRISSKRDNHLKPIPPQPTLQPFCLSGDDSWTHGCLTGIKKRQPLYPPEKTMVKSMAPPAPRECNQPARSALHRIPCIALVNSGIVHPTAVLICPFIGVVAILRINYNLVILTYHLLIILTLLLM